MTDPPKADPKRVAVLISGRGSNCRALIERANGYKVILVASNKPHAPGLDFARSVGIPTWTWDSRGIEREAFDRAVSEILSEHGVGTVALAGYMRMLSPAFIERWRGRIVNIHPSLLPKYKGLDPHSRCLAAGDTVSGCTVHLVTEELDSGEVLAQVEVVIEPGDTTESLAARILEAEHRLYPAALTKFVGDDRE